VYKKALELPRTYYLSAANRMCSGQKFNNTINKLSESFLLKYIQLKHNKILNKLNYFFQLVVNGEYLLDIYPFEVK